MQATLTTATITAATTTSAALFSYVHCACFCFRGSTLNAQLVDDDPNAPVLSNNKFLDCCALSLFHLGAFSFIITNRILALGNQVGG